MMRYVVVDLLIIGHVVHELDSNLAARVVKGHLQRQDSVFVLNAPELRVLTE